MPQLIGPNSSPARGNWSYGLLLIRIYIGADSEDISEWQKPWREKPPLPILLNSRFQPNTQNEPNRSMAE